MKSLRLALVLSAMLASRSAYADTCTEQPDGCPAPPPRMKRDWYGWQTLAVDLTTYVGAIVLAKQTDRTLVEGAPITVPVWILGAPIVHALNGQYMKAGISAAARGAIVGTIVFVGTRPDAPCVDYPEGTCAGRSGIMQAILGGAIFLIGATTMPVVDAALATKPHVDRGVSVDVRSVRGGATVGVAGMF
jgi:hypothetical protein